MAEEDEIISDMPEYSPKSEFSKAELVEQAVLKCIEARGQEMKEGYFNTTIDKNGLIQKQWVPDSREKFFSTVEALKGLLSPETKRDEVFKSEYEEVYNDWKEITKRYEYEEKELKENKGNELVYTPTGKKIIPFIDQTVIIPKFDTRLKRVIGEPIKGGWNDKLNSYKNELIEIYDRFFSILNDLVDRLNYFKPEIGY